MVDVTTVQPATVRSVAAPKPYHRRNSPGVRPVTVDAGGISLSGLLSEPTQEAPRAVIVALHGGGMNAGYFDGQAHPDASLLTLGARLGYTVLALDRPGYGASAARLPAGQRLTVQAAVVRCAVQAFTARHEPGAGTFLLRHGRPGRGPADPMRSGGSTRRLCGGSAAAAGCHREMTCTADCAPTWPEAVPFGSGVELW